MPGLRWCCLGRGFSAYLRVPVWTALSLFFFEGLAFSLASMRLWILRALVTVEAVVRFFAGMDAQNARGVPES